MTLIRLSTPNYACLASLALPLQVRVYRCLGGQGGSLIRPFSRGVRDTEAFPALPPVLPRDEEQALLTAQLLALGAPREITGCVWTWVVDPSLLR